MTIALISGTTRTERRIRLSFSEALAASAFTSPSYYTMTCMVAGGSNPLVLAAFVVSGSPGVVELAIGSDLTPGSEYRVTAFGVPSLYGGSTPADSVASIVLPPVRIPPVQDVAADDFLQDYYGIDLVWDGKDIVESASGDLAGVGGTENVVEAIGRRLASEGLPWSPDYGAKPRAYVDGSRAPLDQLQGSIVNQCMADTRVNSVVVALSPESLNEPEQATFTVDLELLGGSMETVELPIRIG
jgi:hypothetical protein